MNETNDRDAVQRTTETVPNPHAGSPAAESEGSSPEGASKALTEAHSRLEAARKRIDELLMREVEHQAAKRLDVPSDLFVLGNHALSDLLNEGGEIDTGKVTSAIDSLLNSRPALAARRIGWGEVGAGMHESLADDTPDWNTALHGQHR
ncbi:hypothetical protein OG413_18390 [Streptomyces sp. NBC_01433]|uniref:hypothetical protein n=1 Tax=Streptomyces sp. NBC_01433 TaxID=2903864 RepID=UPI00224EF022|nr:hypothetical protein [Streptomyces sp. NBC_01433]MCX4677246.1 hypothetical protein [Streptomyces sp. NBC_01433]